MHARNRYLIVILIIGFAGWAWKAAAGAERTSMSGRFGNPEAVAILGYDGDAMEPFITRDGRYLLFNNSNARSVNTNLHWAERIDEVTFRYRGEIGGVNTTALEGTPTMDSFGILYFVSPRSFTKSHATVYRARFSDGVATDVEIVPGIAKGKAPWVNFDLEVNAAGDRLYVVESRFGWLGRPKTADIAVFELCGTVFKRTGDSDRILKLINTDRLEYAPCISADERELFFTRLNEITPAIYIARRSSIDTPFGMPERIRSITGFAEGPTLSADGNILYFHRKDDGRYRIFLVRREVSE